MRFTLDPRTAAGVEGRARVHALLATNTREALAVARAIEHPWYRCQALAAVAEAIPLEKARGVLQQSLRAAHELEEPNRIVTVASWPVRVLVSREIEGAAEEVERLLAIIADEPHSLRRAHALSMLFGSVFADPALRARVLDPLLASLRVSHGWRAERVWAALVLLMREQSAAAAEQILQAMPEGREKRRLSRATPPPASPPSPV